jgi:hypothetical protein
MVSKRRIDSELFYDLVGLNQSNVLENDRRRSPDRKLSPRRREVCFERCAVVARDYESTSSTYVI